MPKRSSKAAQNPWRDWRENVREFVIVVAGVFVALVAQQAVNAWDWHRKVQASEDAMRWELLADDGPEIYQRAAMHPCIVASLDSIGSPLGRAPAGHRPPDRGLLDRRQRLRPAGTRCGKRVRRLLAHERGGIAEAQNSLSGDAAAAEGERKRIRRKRAPPRLPRDRRPGLGRGEGPAPRRGRAAAQGRRAFLAVQSHPCEAEDHRAARP